MKHAAVIPAILAALALAHVAAFAADTDDIPEMPVMSAVVAEVNGVVITFGDLWEEVEVPVRELRKTYHGRDLQRRINMLLVTQLERKKNGILLLTEAESLLTDQVSMQLHEQVAKRIRTLVHEAGSMAALKDSLLQQGKDLEDVQEDIRKDMLIGFLLNEHVYSKITVSPEEMRRYYEDHPGEFEVARSTTIIHVFLPRAAFDTPEEARLRAGELYRKTHDGADITEIARKHSRGPKAPIGGVWDNVHAGAFRKEVDFFVFSMAQGELSPVIETGLGYHIVKVIKNRPAKTLTFEEAQHSIHEKIYEKKFRYRRAMYLKDLEKHAFVRLLWQPK